MNKMDNLGHRPMQHTNKLLLVCFFTLGMGLFAPVASIWQSMDYLNAQYEAYYPSRIMSTGYNMMYMVLVYVMFLWGSRIWPNKHSRLMTGYLLYVAALATPPAVDQVLLNYLNLCGSKAALQGALACWAVAAAIAGAGDAVISSTIYAEAAAAGSKYTHAFFAGKAACGVVMAGLRCVSKAVMPATLTGLQHSTGIYSAAGAALVLVCVALVAWVLPSMREVLEKLREHSGLTVEQTLHEIDVAVAQAHLSGHAVHKQPAHRRDLSTCSSCATISAAPRHHSTSPCCDKQLASKSYPPHTPRQPPTHRLSVFQEGLFLHGAHYSLPQLMQAAMAHSTSEQHDMHLETAGSISSGLQSSGSWVLNIPSDGEENETIIINALGGSSRCSSTRSTLSLGSHRCSSEDLHGCEHLACTSSCCCTLEQLPEQEAHMGLQPDAAATAASRTCTLDAASKQQQHEQKQPPQQLHSSKELACVADCKPKAAHPLAGVKLDKKSLPSLETRSIFTPSSGGPPSSWMAIKLIYPYQIAAFIPPLITAAIMPMCMSSQVGQSRALGSWYIQVLVLAVQLGGFCGSAMIPVVNPKYPRATLLSAACAMFLFIAGFAVALKRGLFALGFIPLSFAMQACAGYLTTCVFCLAPRGLVSADAELVQQLLVLTTALSFAGGTSISWAWLAAGKTHCP